MTGAATPTTASSPGYTVFRIWLPVSAVPNDPVMGTRWPSVPVAVPAAVYVVPKASGWLTVQLLRSADNVPVTAVPSDPVSVRESITPCPTVTLTGPAGATSVVPKAGDALTVATGGGGGVDDGLVGALAAAVLGPVDPVSLGPAVVAAAV